MAPNLRISLTLLSIGFAVEGGGELYTLLAPDSARPAATVWFLGPALLTVLGILFVWVGRHEWNETHATRTRRASLLFVLSLLGGFVAAGVLALLALEPSLGTPLWAEVLFGAGIASLLFGTFVTYAYLVLHLVRPSTRAVLVVALLWALVVAAFITLSLASALPTTLSLIETRQFTVPSFLSPVDHLISFLFASYFLLLAVYIDAHLVVAGGRPARRPPPTPGPPGAGPA
jgi:hypothetical protein